MNFIAPPEEELTYLRADPLLVEQELDVRPDVAKAIEHAAGRRAGRVYWRSEHDHLYALELGDLGRGQPSLATVFGFWDRFEPRPPEHEIDADLLDFCLWVAEVAPSLSPGDIARAAQHANVKISWPEGAVLRTPEERFHDLPDFPYEPRYADIEGLRMAYVEAGSGDPILMLHGEPTWSYLYRHMIPPMSQAGRVIAPDLVGFGRSDKPVAANAYSYRSHARWLRKLIEALNLRRITIVCQDWGGLLGLRILSQSPERFARVVAMNTGIGSGAPRGGAFLKWRRFALRAESLDVGKLMNNTLVNRKLTDPERAAYDAPFPSKEYQRGALTFPRLVPIRHDHPGAYDNRVATERLRKLELPVLLIWGKKDAITAPSEAHLRTIFQNCGPTVWLDAGHFIQEDAGSEVAARILEWM